MGRGVTEFFREPPGIMLVFILALFYMLSAETLYKEGAVRVNDLYIGNETGLDDVLQFMNKGTTLQDSIDQAQRLNDAGIHHRALFMLGVAGKGRGEESALAAAEFINKIRPDMARFTTMTVFPDCPLAEDVAEGRFVESGELENLIEEKLLFTPTPITKNSRCPVKS